VKTFLEYWGSKLSNSQRKQWQSKSSPFKTDGDFRGDGGRITSIDAIPDSRQHDGSLHPKVEKMRLNQSTQEILSPADVSRIADMYNISNLSPTSPKQLSNTGIIITYSAPHNAFILKRS